MKTKFKPSIDNLHPFMISGKCLKKCFMCMSIYGQLNISQHTCVM